MGIGLIKMTEHGRFHLYPNFPNDKLPAATHTVRTRIWKVNMKKDLHSTQNDRFEKWSQLRKSPAPQQTNQNNAINRPKIHHPISVNARCLCTCTHITFIYLSVAFDQIWRFIQMKNDDWLNLSFHFLWLLLFLSLSDCFVCSISTWFIANFSIFWLPGFVECNKIIYVVQMYIRWKNGSRWICVRWRTRPPQNLLFSVCVCVQHQSMVNWAKQMNNRIAKWWSKSNFITNIKQLMECVLLIICCRFWKARGIIYTLKFTEQIQIYIHVCIWSFDLNH